MTEDVWNTVRALLLNVPNPPVWLEEFTALGHDEISKLPELEQAKVGQITMPWVETKKVSADYLNFLREQIRIDARGPEWKQLLESRLASLEPYAGLEILTITLHKKPHGFVLRIDPRTEKAIHFESY